jgi:hypothetical protein
LVAELVASCAVSVAASTVSVTGLVLGGLGMSGSDGNWAQAKFADRNIPSAQVAAATAHGAKGSLLFKLMCHSLLKF